MIDNMQLFWFSLCFFFLFLEMGHPGLLYFLSFSVGALCACVAAFCTDAISVQLGLFLCGTSLALLFVYIIMKRKENQLTSPSHRSNTDALIGKKVTLFTSSEDDQVWLASIQGQIWRVESLHADSFKINEQAVIVGVQGCHLKVDKISRMQAKL